MGQVGELLLRVFGLQVAARQHIDQAQRPIAWIGGVPCYSEADIRRSLDLAEVG